MEIPDPVLCVQTVYFDGTDRAAAWRLGQRLYELLARPLDDPLAHGPRVPVFWAVDPEFVDTGGAQHVVIIPVLGTTMRHLDTKRVVERIKTWRATDNVTVVPVLRTGLWAEPEQVIERPYVRSTGPEVSGGALRSLLREIGAAHRSGARFHATVSNTPHDRLSGSIANEVRQLLSTEIEAKPDGPGAGDRDDSGVLVVVRGDRDGIEPDSQRELLAAKRERRPAFTIEALGVGESRSPAYGGNVTTQVWAENADAIATRVVAHWVRAGFFEQEARRLVSAAKLPDDTVVLCRPPELVDVFQGPLRSSGSQVVVYPDPELGVVERNLLRRANPRLHTATPSTLHRRLLARAKGPESTNLARALDPGSLPLLGLRIAFSVSESPSSDGPEGFVEQHIRDAVVQLAGSLISSGASIAYAGDFREHGYTPLFATLIEAHNHGGVNETDRLHCYRPADRDLEDAPDHLDVLIRWLGGDPAGMPAKDAEVYRSEREQFPSALFLSDMRRVITLNSEARVVVGGRTRSIADDVDGYTGRFPGILEEAWWSFKIGMPLYVLGGFGGAARIVTKLLRGENVEADLSFADSEEGWKGPGGIDVQPRADAIGLPRSLAVLADQVAEAGAKLGEDDAGWVKWNGLTRRDNETLFESRDPLQIAALVSKGLAAKSRKEFEEKLSVELVHGGLADIERVDAVVVGAFDGQPVAEEGAELDPIPGKAINEARMQKVRVFASLESEQVNADFLHCSGLGPLSGIGNFKEIVQTASREVAALARAHGFVRLAVTSFGGRLLDLHDVARAMLRGFKEGDLFGRVSVVWLERDPTRFEELCSFFENNDFVTFRSRHAAVPASASWAPAVRLFVTLEGDRLTTVMASPRGEAAVERYEGQLDVAQLDALAAGEGVEGRVTPGHVTLKKRSHELGRLLLHDDYEQFLDHCSSADVEVFHDVASSRLPFEVLVGPALGAADSRPDERNGAGVTRRLIVSDLPAEWIRAESRRSKIRVLLVANPTSNLESAETEGHAVQELFERDDRFELVDALWRDEATVERVIDKLPQADVFHYAGHGFFHVPGKKGSGLILAGKKRLTLAELLEEETPLRLSLAFVNACEAGKLSPQERPLESSSFAGHFLRQRVRAYVGTQWKVLDSSAKMFAPAVYRRLESGQSLAHAVRSARVYLKRKGCADWANYRLFGDGRFGLADL